MGIWHYFVPIAQRRRMKELDQHYRRIIDENLVKNRLSIRSNLIRTQQNDYNV